MEEWCRIPPIEFQTLVESMPWCIEAVLVARGGPTTLLKHVVGVSFILAVTCINFFPTLRSYFSALQTGTSASMSVLDVGVDDCDIWGLSLQRRMWRILT